MCFKREMLVRMKGHQRDIEMCQQELKTKEEEHLPIGFDQQEVFQEIDCLTIPSVI